MCGIAGFSDLTKNKTDLQKMMHCIHRRGPDDQGIYFENGVGLGHLRLSIIDLSKAGHQPMFFENLVIVFNGEIYNYTEVQKELKKKGYNFSSSSDTEVVIKAFHCWGPECVKRFIGMFAIAIYDKIEKALYLVRDRVGVKPLYYYSNTGKFAFASELKSFKEYLSPSEKASINTDALSQFLSVGYTGNGQSIVNDVKKIPQAHYLKYQNGKIEVTRYWDVAFRENENWFNRNENDLVDELEAIIISSFKYRMVADVPVGVFLSAGIDSSLVTAVLTKHFGQIRTFTIGFNEEGYDESGDAKNIASYLDTIHKEKILDAKKAYEVLEHFYDIYDEPHADNSCVPTAVVSELAKNNGAKVVLSADGGDELFGGYERYTQYLNRWQQLQKMHRAGKASAKLVFDSVATIAPTLYRKRLNRFSDILAKKSFIDFYQTIIRSSSVNELKAVYPGYVEPLFKVCSSNILNQMCEWDFNHYMTDDILVKVDRATMYHSIEGREPFLDHRLIEFAAQLPLNYKIRNGQTKYILKKLLGRYLPKQLYDLPKRGFGAPLQAWIKDFYKDKFFEVLGADNIFFDKKEMARLLKKHQAGDQNNYVLLWYLFSFQLWCNQWKA